mmetsp:Transcript_37782/g.81200  ORF Transcript_37782/g.81200 Transcript_37782/m.81200 type:complete len:303 (-) Transcript_37782:47-955(-)
MAALSDESERTGTAGSMPVETESSHRPCSGPQSSPSASPGAPSAVPPVPCSAPLGSCGPPHPSPHPRGQPLLWRCPPAIRRNWICRLRSGWAHAHATHIASPGLQIPAVAGWTLSGARHSPAADVSPPAQVCLSRCRGPGPILRGRCPARSNQSSSPGHHRPGPVGQCPGFCSALVSPTPQRRWRAADSVASWPCFDPLRCARETFDVQHATEARLCWDLPAGPVDHPPPSRSQYPRRRPFVAALSPGPLVGRWHQAHRSDASCWEARNSRPPRLLASPSPGRDRSEPPHLRPRAISPTWSA